MIVSRGARVLASRRGQLAVVRQYSRSVAKAKEPKLHNADGKWAELKAKRPIDEDETHVSSMLFWIPHSVGKLTLSFLLHQSWCFIHRSTL